ncbi:MAG: DOMON-like domain-containing protein [Parasphingorhabdus sp.]|uniref:DOMON-like domain-containing protein n=1 Tax=Parasphingorhabdus sp. TaxID=2709688 RepID=UPI003001BF3B
MRLSLECHPLTPMPEVDTISLNYEWRDRGILLLRYHVRGTILSLDLPDKTDPSRVDELWKTTCFELFLQETKSNGYCEFNFSPSASWAAYQFSGYRDGMTNLILPTSPVIIFESSSSHVALEIVLDLSKLSKKTPHNAAFSAVIADNNGSKSYWALSHPSEKPDFHHKDSFSHKLKAAHSL